MLIRILNKRYMKEISKKEYKKYSYRNTILEALKITGIKKIEIVELF